MNYNSFPTETAFHHCTFQVVAAHFVYVSLQFKQTFLPGGEREREGGRDGE